MVLHGDIPNRERGPMGIGLKVLVFDRFPNLPRRKTVQRSTSKMSCEGPAYTGLLPE